MQTSFACESEQCFRGTETGRRHPRHPAAARPVFLTVQRPEIFPLPDYRRDRRGHFSARRSVADADAEQRRASACAFLSARDRAASHGRADAPYSLCGRPSTDAPALRRLHPRHGALRDQFPLEFGHHRENAEDHPALRVRRIDGRPFAGQHLQADVPALQVRRDHHEI